MESQAPAPPASVPSFFLRAALGAALAAALLFGPATAEAQEPDAAASADTSTRAVPDRLTPTFGEGPAVWGEVGLMDALPPERTPGFRTLLWPELAPAPAPTPPGALYGTPWGLERSPLRLGTDGGEPGVPFGWDGTPLRFVTVEVLREPRR